VTGYRDQVAAAVEAVAIQSRHRFTWLGESSPPLARGVASALPERAARDLLSQRIRFRLYESFYCLGGVGMIERSSPRAGRWSDPHLVAMLSAANSGRGTWEKGWRLDARGDDRLLVSRNGLRVQVTSAECRPPGGGARIGAEVAVALPPELRAWSPGFFTVLGDVNLEPARTSLVARLYFNVSCAGAQRLVSEITSALNGAGAPFRLKVADHPELFRRCDSAVLYLPASDFRRRRRLVGRVVDACASHLQPPVPVFTKPLAPGVGLGEEREDASDSFGMRRCRVLADGLVSAHAQRLRTLSDRLDVVDRRFAEAGIDLNAPYLEPGSVDDYSL
jgi:hypothetical protein